MFNEYTCTKCGTRFFSPLLGATLCSSCDYDYGVSAYRARIEAEMRVQKLQAVQQQASALQQLASSPYMDQQQREDIMRRLAQMMEEAMLNGDGSGRSQAEIEKEEKEKKHKEEMQKKTVIFKRMLKISFD